MTSEILKGSDSLCRLLRYLAEHAVEHSGVPIKEYAIATEVFGRSADFDPRLDSTVRVQTGRLRSKLAEYYASKGAQDQLILDLPKGSYSLAISERPVAGIAPPALVPAPSPSANRARSTSVSVWVLGIVCLALLAALLDLLFTRPLVERAAAKAPSAFRTFWAEFVDGPERPWVVFSNAPFVGRPETGMRYFDATRDKTPAILDHYTGVGEVLAIHELDGLFALLDHGVRVKRGRLLSMDDAKNNDLIFVGSPSENLSLREIPGTLDFVFRNADSGPRKGDLRIVNLKPQQGEPDAFWASRGTPTVEDYALIGLFTGMNANRWVMILAGTTTLGTQAAVEFVTHERSVRELIGKAGTAEGHVRSFEAVVRVGIKGGVPVSTELVALHPRSAQ